MLSVGSIIGGAFRLVQEKPRAVAVWALIYLAVGVATTFVMRPVFEMQANALGGDQVEAMANFWSVYRWIIPFQIVTFALFIVMFTASLRAVLRPDEGGIGYLRFGMDELRMIGLALLLAILFYVGMIVVGLVLIAILVPVFVIGGGGSAFVVALVPLLLLGAALCFYVRLSLSFPLTLMRRKIVIGESWRRTRGRFWTLLGGYLVIFLILIVFSVAVASVTAAPFFTEMMRGGFSPENAQRLAEEQLRQLSDVGPMTFIGWILNAIAGGLMVALLGGATGTAARELAGAEFVASEFA